MLPSFLSATRHVSNGYATMLGSRGSLTAAAFSPLVHPIKRIPVIVLISMVLYLVISVTKVCFGCV